MASRTDIANRALSLLGDIRITSLEDDNKPGRAMNARFDILRDAELAAHPWSFARTRTTLAALSSAPSWGYSKAYQRPADDLRTLSVGGEAIRGETVGLTVRGPYYGTGSSAAYEIVGGQIHTDMGAPLKYEYIRRVTDSGLFAPLFVEALAARLAYDAAEELTQSGAKQDRAMRHYEWAVSEARRVNALSRPPQMRDSTSWLRARA